jgi:uncharacterized iron-regulated membrane protein
MTPAFWRKWHRWLAFPATLFLLFAAVTGVITAMTEFFGAEEALREATRDIVSPVRTDSAAATWQQPLERAVARAAAVAPGAPIDRIQIQFKGPQPTVDVFLGKPGGGEDRWLVIDAGSGGLLRTDGYVDKPLIHRIHSGEAFGDGGLVFAMIWGTSLAFLTVSGLIIYLTMRRKNLAGLQRVFW